MDPRLYDVAQDLLVITYQTFVVRTPRYTVLIDTCTGEDKGYGAPFDYPKTPWREGLAQHGLDVADIDYVFCTHLHIDHCGWNTVLVDGRWVPTFPRATYIFSRAEYEYWETETARGASPPDQVWTMNCRPLVEAGQARLVDDDFQLDETLWLTPSPGHSPGHVCVNIASRGQRAVFTGDVMHHALQCREPAWSSCFCADPALGNRTRQALLGALSDEDVMVVPAHFPGATAGRIVSTSRGWDFRFVDA
jgi:glyoxylase-like metal-dependent hydrolase (beta-lactamase superfamily II)